MTRTDNWTKFRKHNSLPDEITNYIISYILSEGVVINVHWDFWTTDASDDVRACPILLAYGGEGRFIGNTCQNTNLINPNN